MDKASRRILKENIGRPVRVEGLSLPRGAIVTERYGLDRREELRFAYLFDGLEQEQRAGGPKTDFVFVYPYQLTAKDITFSYGLVFEDKIAGARLEQDNRVHGYNVVCITPERGALARDNAGSLYAHVDIKRFTDSVKKFYPDAPFLKQKPLTLLVEGLHI